MVEIAPESPFGYEAVAKWEWELNGRIDESIRWMSKAMEIDPQRPDVPRGIGHAYSALGDPDIALAYFDLAKAITPSDNERRQKALLVEQAYVRLISGEYDVYQLAEQPSVMNALKSAGRIGVFLGVLLDLATERPADALARLEAAWPECVGAVEIPDTHWGCPNEFIRVYQELGDHEAAQVLIDADVHRFQFFGSHWPDRYNYFSYAGKFATGGRTDLALDLLEKIVWSGWRGDFGNKHLRYYLCCDVAFDAIRDHERFRAIVATIEADMAQQLENVREMQRRGEVPTLEEVKALIAAARESG
jgi:tetratricopeptide (TPR) repeat protein